MDNLCIFSVSVHVWGFFAGLGCFVCELEIRWYKEQVPEKIYIIIYAIKIIISVTEQKERPK